MRTQRYDTDLTDEQFALVEPFLPQAQSHGRPPRNAAWRCSNGILSAMVRSGCQCGDCCRTTSRPGVLSTPGTNAAGLGQGHQDRINEAEASPAGPLGRRTRPQPARSSAADSQSVKTTPQVGTSAASTTARSSVGPQAAEHIWGRQHGVAAGRAGDGGRRPRLPRRLRAVPPPAVGGAAAALEVRVYTDNGVCTAHCLDEEVFSWSPFRRVVVSRPEGSEGFVKLPQRWVVERTVGRLNNRPKRQYTRMPGGGLSASKPHGAAVASSDQLVGGNSHGKAFTRVCEGQRRAGTGHGGAEENIEGIFEDAPPPDCLLAGRRDRQQQEKAAGLREDAGRRAGGNGRVSRLLQIRPHRAVVARKPGLG